MQEIIEGVEKLAYEELERANVKFGMFHSTHEGHSVIKEEIEETEEELKVVKQMLDSAWINIRGNTVPHRSILAIRNCSIKLAAEAIQVASMAQKFIDSSKQWKVADINE